MCHPDLISAVTKIRAGLPLWGSVNSARTVTAVLPPSAPPNPPKPPPESPNRSPPTWALAASVSFAAVVAWQQFGRDPGLTATPVVVAQAVPPAAPSERDDSYLMAHQEAAIDPAVMKASLQSEVRH